MGFSSPLSSWSRATRRVLRLDRQTIQVGRAEWSPIDGSCAIRTTRCPATPTRPLPTLRSLAERRGPPTACARSRSRTQLRRVDTSAQASSVVAGNRTSPGSKFSPFVVDEGSPGFEVRLCASKSRSGSAGPRWSTGSAFSRFPRRCIRINAQLFGLRLGRLPPLGVAVAEHLNERRRDRSTRPVETSGAPSVMVDSAAT